MTSSNLGAVSVSQHQAASISTQQDVKKTKSRSLPVQVSIKQQQSVTISVQSDTMQNIKSAEVCLEKIQIH